VDLYSSLSWTHL